MLLLFLWRALIYCLNLEHNLIPILRVTSLFNCCCIIKTTVKAYSGLFMTSHLFGVVKHILWQHFPELSSVLLPSISSSPSTDCSSISLGDCEVV